MYRRMRSASALALSLALLVAPLTSYGQRADSGGAPAAELTRRALFSIPFYLNQSSNSPTEVHLYVSGNRGKAWSLYQRRRPQQRKFDFQAGEDGEYWFVVRTDEDRELPNSTTRAEKVVVVDRSEPQLTVELNIGPSGELVGTYHAEDPNLDAGSLRLEYRLSDADSWQPVALDRATSLTDSSTLKGQATWVVAESPGVVQIRAEVSDRAGNRHEFEKPLDVRPHVSSTSGSTLTAEKPVWQPSTGPAVAAATGSVERLPWLEDPTHQASPEPGVDPHGWRSLDTNWPTTVALPADVAPSVAPEPLGTIASPGRPAAPQLETTSQATKLEQPDDLPHANDGPPAPAREPYAPPVASRFEPTQPPPRRDVQMTSSRRFNLDYDVAGSGPLGVARVELWITQNNGSTWRPFGLDRDLQSPFLVELDQEGIFGFSMLIHNQDGTSARPPQAGDDADLWIGVDWTAPRAQLLEAKIDVGPSSRTVQVQWRAEDEFLAESPVKLSYAPSPNGPWSTIATNVANTGSYAWVVAQPLPTNTYLQLEVRDRAGNVATVYSPAPIGTGTGGPKGIIRGIRPVTTPMAPVTTP